MVHALINARRVLTRQGLLLDIHPMPARPTICWMSPERGWFVGRLKGRRKRFRVAQENLDRVVRQGLFRLRHSEVFVLRHHAVSLSSLLAYVAREFPRSQVDNRAVRRARDLLGPRAVGHLVIEERTRVSILTKI